MDTEHSAITEPVRRIEVFTGAAAGSVGIPPAPQDKARGQASPAQIDLWTAAAGQRPRSLVLTETASERAAQPSAGNIMHLFVRKPVYPLIYSLRRLDQRSSARSFPN
jgi:hypothetical protein